MTDGTLLVDRPMTGASVPESIEVRSQGEIAKTVAPWRVSWWMLRGATTVALVVWCAVTSWLAWHRIISPDEYESVHQGWLIATGSVPFRDFATNHPPLYFYLLSLFSHFTDDGVHLIHIGRAVSWFASCITLGLIARITWQLYGRAAACWAVLAWSFHATMWEWTIEARTDAWLVPCWLLAITIALDHWPRRRACQWIVTGMCLGTAFWINQKAVLHSLPVGLYIMFISRHDRRRWFDIGWALIGSLIPTICVVVHLAYHDALAALHLNIFSGGSDLVKEDPYGYFRTLTVTELSKHDPGYVGLVLLSTLAAIGSWRVATTHQRFVVLATLWMMLTFLTTPGPFGYYLMSILPLATVTIGGWLAKHLSATPSLTIAAQRTDHETSPRVSPKLVAVVVLYLVAPVWRLNALVAADNLAQCRVIRVGQTLIDKDACVFDLSGALAGRRDAYPFHTRLTRDGLKRFSEQLPPLLPALRQRYVPLLISTDRVWFYWNEDDRAVLRHQFPSLWGPLCVPGYDSLEPLSIGTHEFELWYEADYESSSSQIVIDGKSLVTPQRLAAGKHRVTISDEPTRVRLLDAAYRARPALPPDPVTVEEFLYQFWIVRHFFRFD